ncbi:hypothetical protein [Haloarcula onubensis]|uniref:Uncharacterized protein n=1 Tax=Haloarcula onubensis TaxID=2950539 RepID=A0ABU2FT54_9EURY|nr:hypothetical protein [Halomicroarcula sp. S3CR25-11]MDS0283944.1 hypothetical protein [Halomicroarcula sp. S3CR25-11]
MDTPANADSRIDPEVAMEQRGDGDVYTERTAAKTDFGTRAEPVDGLYGYTSDGDPIVPERGQLMRARTNANGQPADALIEPDSAGDLASWNPGNASSKFVDPTGEQVVGVASGLDESAGRTTAHTPPTPTSKAVDRRMQAYDRPDDAETHDHAERTETTTGLETADLEVLLPDGEYVRLGDLVTEPEQFAGSSLESIERSLALEAEKRKVTDGICHPGELSDDVELVGHAKWLNNRFDELASTRPTAAELAEAREKRAKQAHKDRLRPLLELDPDEHEEVCAMAHRLLSDDFEKVYEVRKSPLTLALALAERVNRGVKPTNALLRQAEDEANDPQNVQKIGNVRYMSTAQTKGRFSTQGRVSILFENTHPGIKQAGVLQDETGTIRFAIWAKSEWDETRPTPDPTDFGGRTLIRSHRFPELHVGDVVRVENVIKGWYGNEATFETRRDSELTILERASDESERDEPSPNAATAQKSRQHRHHQRTGPKTIGKPVSKNPIAYWRGSESWVFPVTDWTPDWWLAQENVESVGTSDAETMTGRKVTTEP